MILRERADAARRIRSGTVPEILGFLDAYWVFRGLPNECHAELSGGDHSGGYANVSIGLQFSNIRNLWAREMVTQLESVYDLEKIDAVISSVYAAEPIGLSAADELERRTGKGVIFVHPEKGKKDDKEQVWTGRYDLYDGAVVWPVEELITSMATKIKVEKALKAAYDVEYVRIGRKSLVSTIVHRPGSLPKIYENLDVLSLHEVAIEKWNPNGPDGCKLCKVGSRAVKPKANWELLKNPGMAVTA